MVAIPVPVQAFKIKVLIEDYIKETIECTPLRITYKAFDRDAARIATAKLLSTGLRAQFYPVTRFNQVAWHIHASIP